MEEVGGAPQPPIDTFGGPFRGKHVAPRPRVASSPDRFCGRACRSATAESHPDEEYCRSFTRDKIPRLPGNGVPFGFSGRGANRPTSKDFAVAQKMALYFGEMRSIAHLRK
jgi:hypothetical protein